MSNRVLVDLVIRRGLGNGPEPVATASLAHVLSTSQPARAALADLVGRLCPGIDVTDLEFEEQSVGSTGHSRPDLVGTSAAGPVLVVEAKFEAGLTEAQLGSAYLDRLHADRPGLLLFLVPSDRVPAIWPVLACGPGGVPPTQKPAPDPEHLRQLPPTIKRDDGRCVAVVTWTRLLDLLRAAVDASGTPGPAADLLQLESLVAWRTQTHWAPKLAMDLPGRTGRQLEQLVKAIKTAAKAASSTKTRNGTKDRGPGRYLTSPEGRELWAGIWYRAWGDYGVSPAWVWVEPEPEHRAAVRLALAPLRQPGGPGVFEYQEGWGIPLVIRDGAELPQVTGDFAAQMLEIAKLVDQSGVDTVVEPEKDEDEEDEVT